MAERAASRTVRLGDVLRHREFAWLLVALLQSQVGNQLARVALAVLVFDRTGSPGATSAVFALTFLPAIIGGLLLGQVADRWPRRDVMITCDLIRGGLFAALAAAPLPLAAIYLLVGVSALLGPLFGAAQMATLPALVGADRFPSAAAIVRTGDQIASVAGYGFGGLMVAILGARTSLISDAASFALSSAIIGTFLARGAVDASPRSAGIRANRLLTVAGAVFRDRQLRLLVGLACVVGCYVTPEALAAPYADQIGGGAIATGLLMASLAVGVAIGNLLLVRFVSAERRERLIGVLAMAAAVPLIACVGAPPPAVSIVLWFLCGTLCSFVVVATATYSIRVPDSIRGTAIGIASSCLLGSQGLASLIAGAIAAYWSPSAAIAVSAVAGMALSAVAAVALTAAWRTTSADPVHV